MENKKTNLISSIFIHLTLAFLSFLSIYPFYWMLMASTLHEKDIFKIPPKLIPSLNFITNYDLLVSLMPIWRSIFNSIFISGVTTITTVFLGALAGYTFAKFKFPGRDFLFITVLLTMMLPLQISIIPLFIIMNKLQWIDTYYALTVPFLVSGYGVFLMRQQMFSFPDELLQSSKIDGNSELGTFFRIVLPTMLPACAALGIITFMNHWGNFIWPLVVVNSKEMFTLPLLLSYMVEPGNVIRYGAVLVGAVMGLVPIMIFFLSLQKYFVSGMFGGAVKG